MRVCRPMMGSRGDAGGTTPNNHHFYQHQHQARIEHPNALWIGLDALHEPDAKGFDVNEFFDALRAWKDKNDKTVFVDLDKDQFSIAPGARWGKLLLSNQTDRDALLQFNWKGWPSGSCSFPRFCVLIFFLHNWSRNCKAAKLQNNSTNLVLLFYYCYIY